MIDAEQSTPIQSRSNGGLRGEALPELIITEDEFPFLDDGHRALQTTANVNLVNNCGFKASVGIIFYTKEGKKYKWPTIVKGGVYQLPDVSQSTIYLYGRNVNNPGKLVWGTTSSKHCIGKGKCLEPRSIGSLAKSPVRHKLCNSGSSPVAAPTAAAVPAQSAMTEKDTQFLDTHNDRRNKFYSDNGLGPKNMKHSQDLKSSAQKYANKLIDIAGDTRCVIQHGYEGDDYGGENLGTVWGNNPAMVGHTPEKVLQGWYDNEIGLPYGQKGHATQVVFRSTHYVGCAQASKTLYHGGKCFIYVCRYLSPGNCNMSATGWKQRTLDDEVLCLPKCPKEGCF